MKTKVLHGDPIAYTKLLQKRFKKGVDLVFVCMPVNIGVPYIGDTCSTFIPLPVADREVMDWMESGWDLLGGDGVLAVHCHTTKAASMVRDAAVSYGYKSIGEIVSWYDCPVVPKSSRVCPDNYATLLLYAKGREYTLNTTDSTDTWWTGGCVLNVHEEVEYCGVQLPEEYAEKVVELLTDFGDTIVDLYGGTGTLATVASYMKRNVITIDESMAQCRKIEKRIKKGPQVL